MKGINKKQNMFSLFCFGLTNIYIYNNQIVKILYRSFNRNKTLIKKSTLRIYYPIFKIQAFLIKLGILKQMFIENNVFNRGRNTFI